MNGEEVERPSGFSRRDVLKRGAVVGAAAVWTIPLIEAVSMTPAHAQSPSAPSGGGGQTQAPPPATGSVAPETTTSAPAVQTTTPPAGGAAAANVTGNAESGSLAFTGVDVPVPTAIGTATAAIALGVGALAAGAAYNKQRGGESKPAHRG